MALKDRVTFGMSLPHRSAEPIPATVVRQVAIRAENLGFQDLWVASNTLDEAQSLDSLTTLAYAAAITTTIRLGVSVLVLPIYHPVHVAHQVATLDRLSGGRMTLGVGIGMAEEYEPFQVPTDRRVRRFVESVGLIKALWAGPHATYDGEIFQARDVTLGTRPTRQPHPPIWMGGAHPDAIRRAAGLSDGWMAGGGSSTTAFERAVPLLLDALRQADRDPTTFPISKRIFISVHENPTVARAEVDHWFSAVYGDPAGADTAGVFGTPPQVREQIEQLAAMGANHLLVNPVTRYLEQTEALAEIVGLPEATESNSSVHHESTAAETTSRPSLAHPAGWSAPRDDQLRRPL